jgi:hypothetical protein
MLSWHYIWNEDNGFFHHLLQDSIKDPGITLKPTVDSGLNRADFFINILKSAMKRVNEEPYIFFTDVDVSVKPGVYEALKPHMDRGETMVFLKEAIGQNSATQTSVNTGAILFKVCPEVIEFWELVRARALSEKGDQDYVNELLVEYPGTWALFDESKFCRSNDWTGNTDYVILQIRSSNIGKEFHIAEKIFGIAQLGIDMEKYMKHVPEHIIQKIYEFQEILAANYRQCQITGSAKLQARLK